MWDPDYSDSELHGKSRDEICPYTQANSAGGAPRRVTKDNREVKIATCTASATCDVIVREGGIPSCRCERVNLTFSTPSSPSTRSTGTAGKNL